MVGFRVVDTCPVPSADGHACTGDYGHSGGVHGGAQWQDDEIVGVAYWGDDGEPVLLEDPTAEPDRSRPTWCHLHPLLTLDDDGSCEGCAHIAMCDDEWCEDCHPNA